MKKTVLITLLHKNIVIPFLLLFAATLSVYGTIQEKEAKGIYKLENPVTTTYLIRNLSKKSPKLILTPVLEKEIRQKLTSDPLVRNYYRYLQKEAELILEKPLLKRELEGFRLLAVSREMLERMGVLCMVYRIDQSPEILRRIDIELQAVCTFEDWNPQHYLDVAEMSLAVALAADWTGEALPKSTLQLAKKSLIEKGILPSYNAGGERMGWINGSNNWNSVCHGGMIAASLVIADSDPELAAKTIARALDKMPNALKEYAPDGVYPEGPTYWEYGTSYAAIASSMLTSALGSDFGLSASPGFMESANFRLQVTAPSGEFFNFADSGSRHSGSGSVLLAWFAAKTGDGLYFDTSFFEKPENAGRYAGPGLVWLAQFKQKKTGELPLNWCGKGANPVAVFRGDKADPAQFYLAAKGGKANLSHGNMDAGTFVFDLNGVRWVTDPGNQNYYLLNRIGFKLSDHSQGGERWTLLTKKNQGHSTMTVNDARFLVNGQATITGFKGSGTPEVILDMTPLYGDKLKSATRRFVKESNRSVLIEDTFTISPSTQSIVWQLITTADVEIVKGGALLRKNGKQLKLDNLANPESSVSVIQLDPPPLNLDLKIDGLKRIEIRIPAHLVKNGAGTFKVRLSENNILQK